MNTSGADGRADGDANRSPPTVMLVDDHPLWRETLRKVIERQGAGQVIAEAGDGETAVDEVTDVGPDVVVMDVDLPGIDGVAATAQIVAELPDVRVLFLSSFDDRNKVLGAVEAGASGYLLKTAGASEVADGIRRIAAGELVFPPHLADVLLAQLRSRVAHRTNPKPKARDAAPETSAATFRRTGEFWTVAFEGEVAHLGDLKGLSDLTHLLASPGREVLAVELLAAREALPPGPGSSATPMQEGLHPDAGRGTGPALDATAKRAYRQRLLELQDEIDEAEEFGDAERAGRAREELQLLTEQLAAAVGLGGRDRPISSDVERARVSVTRGVRRAIKRIAEVHPALGRHLDRTVRTGTFCCYDPETPVDWVLS